MVFNPWGTKVLDMETDVGIGIVEIDQEKTKKIRGSMPIVDHIRNELY
jgi:predicted amidohydrolase